MLLPALPQISTHLFSIISNLFHLWVNKQVGIATKILAYEAGENRFLSSDHTYLITSIRSLSIEQNRTTSFILIHQARILEMCNECSFSLYTSICKRCYFFTVEFFPFLPIECLLKEESCLRYDRQAIIFRCPIQQHFELIKTYLIE